MEIPRLPGPDHTLAFRREGYVFISRRCDALYTDVFQTRLLLEPTLCMRGRGMAELFYDTRRFRRGDAAPKFLMKTLFGVGGVQGLDGARHASRKAMFMSLMRPEAIDEFGELFAAAWERALPQWRERGRMALHPALREVLCEAACRWAGVPVGRRAIPRFARELGALIDSPVSAGFTQIHGRVARRRLEHWIAERVEAIRRGDEPVPEGRALGVIALYEENGERLPARVAAVEVLNIIRPTVAVARFIVFCAQALHEHPASHRFLREGGDDALHPFAQEVRRAYPFFPVVAARVRHDFHWQGLRFRAGHRALLDLYGTNHDPRIWPQPEVFDPERFVDWQGDPFTLIPQGGGDHYHNHRCPGEFITLCAMKVATRFLLDRLSYRVPPQNLALRDSDIPALPRSRFVVEVR